MKTRDAACGKWYGILTGFGIDKNFLQNRHGPCPMCGGSDRFRFDDREGNGTYYCNNCGSGDGFKLAMGVTGMTFQEVAKVIDERVNNIPVTTAPVSKTDPEKRLRQIAAGRKSMDGINPVRRYLKNRGVSPAPGIEYHPGVKYWNDGQLLGEFPVMLNLLVSPQGINLTYHVTYLTQAGEKAPVPVTKKILPAALDEKGRSLPLAGSAIRLFPVDSHIGIAEGVETALAAAELFGLACWSATNATLLERFEPPAGVERVTIFADNDRNFTGQAAAYALAKRLALKGVGVRVAVPTEVGTDFADQMVKSRSA